MNMFFAVLLIIIGLLVVINFIFFIISLSRRREKSEIMKREMRLYEEKIQAEKAKQIARISGKIARENISKIANYNKYETWSKK